MIFTDAGGGHLFTVAHDDGAGAAAQGPHGLVHRDLRCLIEDHHVEMHRPGRHKGGQGGRIDHEAGIYLYYKLLLHEFFHLYYFSHSL